ncbi:hypothetical protein [Natrinema pallidum]|uniref:Uncharacterized protein n=1 Tax=Natrinema pallidum TaxID=69527 RepID=A0A4P9TGN9_9EURY|nr:hypothetical protein [Natrinema pallidum]QCW02920.1 hypothetical protein FGF80_06575 [Natrinema pallidum]
MEGGNYFFSSLAQVVATAIGFILAFSGVIYTIQKNRAREEIGRMIEETAPVYKKYGDITSTVTDELWEEGDFAAPFKGLTHMFMKDPDLESWAEKQDDQTTALLWAHLRQINTKLLLISSTSNAGNVTAEFDSLEEHIREAKDLTEDDEAVTDIHSELGDSTSNCRNQRVFDISEESPDPFYMQDRSQDYSIKTIDDLNTILTELDSTLHGIRARYTPERVEYYDEPPMAIFRQVVLLFISGVLIPVGFLIRYPDSLNQAIFSLFGHTVSEYLFLLIQLSLIVFISWMLFRSLLTIWNYMNFADVGGVVIEEK